MSFANWSVGWIVPVFCLLMALLCWRLGIKKGVLKPDPYRQIVKRHPRPDGELVELECGHVIRIIMSRTTELPCKECGTANAEPTAQERAPEVKEK